MPPISKKDLRAAMRRKLAVMTPEERRSKSAIIQKKYLNDAYYKDFQTILAYASFGTEVETDEILHACLRDEKRLVLTRLDSATKRMTLHLVKDLARDLEVNRFGIREPRENARRVSPRKIDAIIVPGLAFSEEGERLGRGQGYYDRLLARMPHKIYLIALAFDFQIFPYRYFETESHDCEVGMIFTELRDFEI